MTTLSFLDFQSQHYPSAPAVEGRDSVLSCPVFLTHPHLHISATGPPRGVCKGSGAAGSEGLAASHLGCDAHAPGSQEAPGS